MRVSLRIVQSCGKAGERGVLIPAINAMGQFGSRRDMLQD